MVDLSYQSKGFQLFIVYIKLIILISTSIKCHIKYHLGKKSYQERVSVGF